MPGYDTANIFHILVSHIFEKGCGLAAPASGVAVNKYGSAFLSDPTASLICQRLQRKILALWYMSFLILLGSTYIQEKRTGSGLVFVNPLADLRAFKKN